MGKPTGFMDYKRQDKIAETPLERFRKFYQSLAPGGLLFIGSTEQIINYREIGYERKSSFFYEKPGK